MFNLQDLPVSRGTYALQLAVLRAQPISVGRLGQYHVPAGDYFYIGSAHGAGGLRARVGRHLRGDGALHWHIDYLRAVVEVQVVFYTVADNQVECMWSQALAQLPRAFIPVPRFGSSDCRSGCAAHLIAFSQRTRLASIEEMLATVSPRPVVQLRCR
jgi:Uri superfamily endonuclease